MTNALTIDLEDWYHTLDFNFPVNTWEQYEDRITNSTNIILETLDKHGVKATFFVLGYIAKKHPDLVRKISKKGHEIGSHGTLHKLIYKQTKDEFREDVADSKKLLQDITGKEVNLFRGSSWSISKDTLWALEILEEEGFKCDSSLQPFKTPLSGVNGAPKEPFYPVIEEKRLKIIEFPSTVLPMWKAGVPFSGGLYFRTMPLTFIKLALNKVNEKGPGMIYLHPWEVDVDQPKLKMFTHVRFTHYHNLNKTLNKLENLLDSFNFATLGEIIAEGSFKEAVVK